MGENHPTTAQSMTNLGLALRESKEPDKAVPLLDQAVSIWTNLYPADRYPAGHPSLATGLLNVGMALRDAGRPADARPKIEQALAMRPRLFPPDKFPAGPPAVAVAHQHLGPVLRALKQFPPAVAELEASWRCTGSCTRGSPERRPGVAGPRGLSRPGRRGG